jgi:hypothetical protein
MSRSQGFTCFSLRVSRRASRGVPPLTIGGLSAPPDSAIRRRRLVKDGTSRGGVPFSVAHESADRDDDLPPSGELRVPSGRAGYGMCRNNIPAARHVSHIPLPGTPREARLRVVLPFSKEAAARPNSVVAALQSTARATALFGRRWDARGGPEGRCSKLRGPARKGDVGAGSAAGDHRSGRNRASGQWARGRGPWQRQRQRRRATSASRAPRAHVDGRRIPDAGRTPLFLTPSAAAAPDFCR